MVNGIIIVNPFLIPEESVRQARRLKEEFNNLGVNCQIVSNGYLKSFLKNGSLETDFSCVDFVIYLDKDKYLSQILEKTGVKLFNSHNAIRVCDDKAETYIALSNKGFNIPDTIFGALCYSDNCEISDSAVNDIVSKLSLPIIVKECFGSMGKGVYKADNVEQLKEIMQKVKLKPHLYQKFIKTRSGVDVRLILVGGRVVACMERINTQDFRSNVARGGSGKQITPLPSFVSTAERIAKELELDYCGIDLLYGDNMEPIVCEVNSNAFFEGIEKATGVNVAKKYAEYIIEKVKK